MVSVLAMQQHRYEKLLQTYTEENPKVSKSCVMIIIP
jgi:hypothetical protein